MPIVIESDYVEYLTRNVESIQCSYIEYIIIIDILLL